MMMNRNKRERERETTLLTTYLFFTEVEGAFNLLVVITLQAQDVNAAVKELIKTLTQTESTKTSLKQKM